MAKKPISRLFSYRYTSAYTYGPYAQRILENGADNAKHKVVRDRYASRPQIGLWITTLTNSATARKVIRSKVARKLRMAFAEALVREGYSTEGISVDQGRKSLHGSVMFDQPVWLEILHQREVLERDMGMVVRWIAGEPDASQMKASSFTVVPKQKGQSPRGQGVGREGVKLLTRKLGS